MEWSRKQVCPAVSPGSLPGAASRFRATTPGGLLRACRGRNSRSCDPKVRFHRGYRYPQIKSDLRRLLPLQIQLDSLCGQRERNSIHRHLWLWRRLCRRSKSRYGGCFRRRCGCDGERHNELLLLPNLSAGILRFLVNISESAVSCRLCPGRDSKLQRRSCSGGSTARTFDMTRMNLS